MPTHSSVFPANIKTVLLKIKIKPKKLCDTKKVFTSSSHVKARRGITGISDFYLETSRRTSPLKPFNFSL